MDNEQEAPTSLVAISDIFLRRSTSSSELLHWILASCQIHKRLSAHLGMTDLHQAFLAHFANLLEVCMRQKYRADLHTSVHHYDFVTNIVRVSRKDPHAAHNQLGDRCGE